ncbi:hypothetical protein NKR23_g9130 [Pleurostoma richardsiae]|uniref:Mitochondrial outer membrane protein OM14 C-terminal domain-containing protein n=1 Tax=Pleurostoma richardsiae TaxID=41990 RepID=A0AA38VKI4_9PEZI|nr:hypothetical protein NKR23_g9130 [Pleurostoma richardsiae]
MEARASGTSPRPKPRSRQPRLFPSHATLPDIIRPLLPYIKTPFSLVRSLCIATPLETRISSSRKRSREARPRSTSRPNHKMSYAEVAAKGPKQTPEEAAAPQPPSVVTDESASTASLVDVDAPSVRTVPSDFLEQDVKTETQADRQEREEEAKVAIAAAEKRAKEAKDKAAAKAKKADNWITKRFASLSEDQSTALVSANLAAVVGLSAFLGYKAWGLYEKGRLSWQSVGLGLGVLGVVGLGESVFAGYFYKARGKKQ